MTRPSPGLQVKKLKCEGCYLNKVSIYRCIKVKLCLFKSPLKNMSRTFTSFGWSVLNKLRLMVLAAPSKLLKVRDVCLN